MKTKGRASSGSVTITAAVAGMVAPLVFVIVVIAQGLQYSDYSHMAQPISALAAWPHGWAQNLNFILLGSAMMAVAAGLHRGVRSDRGSIIGPVLLGMSGIGLLLAAAFQWQVVEGGFIVPSGHLAGSVLAFVGAGAGLAVISRRMENDPSWRSMATYTLASGAAIIVLFLFIMFLARSDDAPLHAWLGLLQRLILLVWFSCLIILSRRLWRIIHTTRQKPTDQTAIHG